MQTEPTLLWYPNYYKPSIYTNSQAMPAGTLPETPSELSSPMPASSISPGKTDPTMKPNTKNKSPCASSTTIFTKPSSGKGRSEEHTSELQSRGHLVCRLLPDKHNKRTDWT